MFTGRKGFARLLGLEALLYAVAFVVGTGVIPGWGEWHSSSLHYRRQTDAFFHGELALSHRPVDVEFDLTWSNAPGTSKTKTTRLQCSLPHPCPRNWTNLSHQLHVLFGLANPVLAARKRA